MKESLFDVFSDEHGMMDFRRTRGVSKAKQTNLFLKELHRVAGQKKSNMFKDTDLYAAAKKIGVNTDNFGRFIDMLNNENYILKKGARRYQLMSYCT